MSNQFWVVFATHYTSAHAARQRNDHEVEDEFHIFESEEEARKKYESILSGSWLYCAGLGPVATGTDWGSN